MMYRNRLVPRFADCRNGALKMTKAEVDGPAARRAGAFLSLRRVSDKRQLDDVLFHEKHRQFPDIQGGEWLPGPG